MAKSAALSAGKWWGPRDKQPVLALHGWLDSAASFDPLMSLLPENVTVLCLDMPGHGQSSHYPPGLMYHIMEDIITLRRIVQHFHWKKITMIGHSMGSAYSFFYASLFPTQVDKILGIDILRPFSLDSSKFVKMCGSEIDKFIDIIQNDEKPPEYSENELCERQFKASMGSVSINSSRLLLTRGAYKRNNGLISLMRDVRLKIWYLHRMPHEAVLELASRVRCKVVNIKARPGTPGYYERRDLVEETLRVLQAATEVELFEVKGTHHVHLNNPERIVKIVEKFLCSSA